MAAGLLVCAIRASIRSAAFSAIASASGSTTTFALFGATMVTGASLDRPPPASVARKQLVGCFGPLAARIVSCKPLRARIAPAIDERLHHAPTRLDAVCALKKDGVPDHAVVDQRL